MNEAAMQCTDAPESSVVEAESVNYVVKYYIL